MKLSEESKSLVTKIAKAHKLDENAALDKVIRYGFSRVNALTKFAATHQTEAKPKKAKPAKEKTAKKSSKKTAKKGAKKAPKKPKEPKPTKEKSDEVVVEVG